jgi:hypothetical protein
VQKRIDIFINNAEFAVGFNVFKEYLIFWYSVNIHHIYNLDEARLRM